MSVAENSSLIGWVSLVAAVLVASSMAVLSMRGRPNRSATFSAVAGVLLVAVATMLAALGGGRGLWLTGLGGFLCLTLAVAIKIRTILPNVPGPDSELVVGREGKLYSSKGDPVSAKFLEVIREINLLPFSASYILEHLQRAAAKSEQLVDSALRASQPPANPVDLGKIAQPLVQQGLWAPLSVYTSHDNGLPLKGAVVDVLAAFGCTVVAEEPVERSSWFQRFWAWLHSGSVRDRMRKVEQAVELQYLGKVRADIDQAKAQAVAALLQAISAQDNAVVRIGSLIAIKAQGDLAVWTVGELEAADMEQQSALLRDPVSALAYLRKLKQKPSELPYRPPDEDLL